MGIEITGLALSVIATLISLLTSLLKDSFLVDVFERVIGTVLPTSKTILLGSKSTTGESVPPTHVSLRLQDTKRVYSRQKLDERLSKFISGLLVFGQYVVGGVLATSFIRETLNPQVTGFLGLTVLAATLVHQRYRPNVNARLAQEKASFLYETILKAEDGLEFIRRGSPNAPTEESIIKMLSKSLDKVHDPKRWATKEDEPEPNTLQQSA